MFAEWFPICALCSDFMTSDNGTNVSCTMKDGEIVLAFSQGWKISPGLHGFTCCSNLAAQDVFNRTPLFGWESRLAARNTVGSILGSLLTSESRKCILGCP